MKDFNVQYPPLVEQAYNYMLSQGNVQVTKQEVYKMMVSSGMLNEDGTPTKKALKMGLVEEATDPISLFKANYPIFASVDDKYFKLVNGEVAIATDGVRKAIFNILLDPTAPKWQKEQAEKLMKQLNGGAGNE